MFDLFVAYRSMQQTAKQLSGSVLLQDQLKGMELRDEWQDDELPNIVGEDGHVTSGE